MPSKTEMLFLPDNMKSIFSKSSFKKDTKAHLLNQMDALNMSSYEAVRPNTITYLSPEPSRHVNPNGTTYTYLQFLVLSRIYVVPLGLTCLPIAAR